MLTVRDKNCFQTAERMGSEMLRIQATLGDSRTRPCAALSGSALPTASAFTSWRPSWVLVDRYPGLTLRLVPQPKVFSVSKREVDIAITLDRPEDGRLICQEGRRLPGCVSTPSSAYLARRPAPLSPADLQVAHAGDDLVRHLVEPDDRLFRWSDHLLAIAI